jgi:cellulose synthase/poly-beta-1,6-N-acetylglucosamine synthase-like glycosyltransferase/tetratricopeptide (TPR) repeat protein
MNANQGRRQIVISLSAAMCVSYLFYRACFTLNLTTPFASFASIFLFLGEFYGVFVLMLFYLQVWDSREPEALPPLEGRTVDVFVPTYNEDPQLLRATLEACMRMDYPHETYVCDDGKRPAVAELAKELGVHYVIRPDNRHAKAGNLNHIFAKTHGEFIVILDADHVPEPNFITRLIGYFKDEKLGFVQTPHAFYNFDSFQARLKHKSRRYWEEGHLFYEVIQPGRNRWNCPIFAGSAAMFRRTALAEVGYIAVETITEDMHTGMRVNAKGWKSLAISERLVAGQAAPDVTTFHSQRIRWGEGNLSIMAYDNPLTMRGLTWPQRICYLGSMVHWAGGLFKSAIYLTPILMMFSGVPPVAEFTWGLALITLIYLIASIYGVRAASNGLGSFFNGELFCMINFWTQIRGTMRALFWRKFQKFVVTAKRGRQAKSIWPYIRPQVFLLALSVFALFWGWSRLVLGISDDYFKPIIPTFWILFHMMLGFIVLRRALWPEDRRFSTRHIVHLPVSYAYQGVGLEAKLLSEATDWGLHRPEGMGISMDLNEIGMTLIAYAPLAVKDRLRLTLRGGGEEVHCNGEIQWMKELTPRTANGVAVPRGYRYGIAFKDISPQQLDGLNHLTLHYAVPRMYAEYMEGRRRTFWMRLRQRLSYGLIRRRFDRRVPVHLPMVLVSRAGEIMHTVTEDASRATFSVLSSRDLPIDSEMTFTLHTPLGEVRGSARLARAQRRRYAARDHQFCVFELKELLDQGRVTLDSLLFPRAPVRLEPILRPDKAPVRVPMARPVLLGAAVIVPLLLLQLGGFRVVYRDEFFLRDLAHRTDTIGEDDLSRFEDIMVATTRQAFASTDRLVLLMGALARLNRPSEMDQVTILLAPRDRRNLDLQFALAQALDNSHEYEQAEAEYEHLFGQLGKRVTDERRKDLLLAAARAATHAGKSDTAAARFQEAVDQDPTDVAVRNEVAGVLLAMGKAREAAQLYQNIEPDFTGLTLLVAIHSHLKDFTAAEKDCRAIIKYRPDDAQAKLLLADLLSWKQNGQTQARAIYEQLLKIKGAQPELMLRLAQVALWNKAYDEALQRYQPLVDDRLDQPQVVKSYVDAAASAEKLGAPQRRTALAIYDRILTSPMDDPVLLARLAWVLQRVDELDKSAVLLDRAMELDPKDSSVRYQLLGALASAGRLKDVLKRLEGKEMDFDAHHMLVGVYAKNRDFAAAEKECQEMLKLRPGDFATQRLLADLWSWSKNYKGSLGLLEELRRAHPEDPQLPVRAAEVTLWSGDYEAALSRLHALLVDKFDRPALWPPYVDAASAAKKLTSDHHRMAARIWERSTAENGIAVPFVTRLAWIFHRLGDSARADQALVRGMALRPQDPAARRELAGVLGATGKYQEAISLFEGVRLEIEDRYRLAELHSAIKRFAEAEKHCRDILQDQPDDPTAQRLLADVLSWSRKYGESLTILERLVLADPKDVGLQQRLAEVTLWSGNYDKAVGQFERLLEKKPGDADVWRQFIDAAASASKLTDGQAKLARRIFSQPGITESRDVFFLTRLAWVLHRTESAGEAAKILEQAFALQPRDAEARRELAGVLVAAGKYAEAEQLFENAALEPRDRLSLAQLYCAQQRFAPALEQVRAILRDEPANKAARRFLADILSWNKEYNEALSLLEELVREEPKDAGLAIRLAEVTLWSGAHEKALTRLQALLTANFAQPKLWQCFVDAAAAATRLQPEQLRLAETIADKALAGQVTDPVFLTRLAWVLHNGHAPARVNTILDRAVALKPREPAARRELAGVLAATGNHRQALKLFEGVALDLEDRFRLATLHSAEHDFNAAEIQCRAILREQPKDMRALKLLASVLTWKKDYKASLALLETLAREYAQDGELPVRLAEVLLWSGEYDKALARFQTILEKRFEQPEYWPPFIDAAASARSVNEGQAGLIRRIAERAIAGGPQPDAVFLVRLAWALQRIKQPDKAGILLDRVLAAPPKEPAARKDLARTLAAVGKYVEALRMFENLTLDLDDRYQIVGICGSAARQVRAALEDEPDNKEAAQLAGYLARWNHLDQASLALYEKLLQETPADRRLRVRLAEMTLWHGDYDKAWTYFAGLLETEPDQPDLWRCFVDAAASAETLLTEKHRPVLLRIYDAMMAAETKPEYLSRLAWVYFRHKETARTDRLLDKALALRPAEPAVRKELAGVLAAAGRYDAAVQMYAGLKLTFADRLRLVEIYAGGKHFDAAEREVRALLNTRIGDARAQLLLAAVLIWNKKYDEANSIYRQLQRSYPNDTAISVKLAELALWTGQYDNALVQFYNLLEPDPNRTRFWVGYIDSAASARQLPESHRKLVVHISQKTLESQAGDSVFLVRLAWVLRRFKELDRSVAVLQLALTKDQTARAARHQLAETLYEGGRHEEAEKHLRMLLRLAQQEKSISPPSRP